MFQSTGSKCCAVAAVVAGFSLLACGGSDEPTPLGGNGAPNAQQPGQGTPNARQPGGTSNSDAATGPLALPTSAAPAYVAPIAGRLLASPAALALGVGQSLGVGTASVNGSGQASMADVLRWVSSDPGVATVDASGRVVAAGVGVAVVTVTDSEGRESSLSVAVATEPAPLQPFALRCASPVQNARVGEALALGPIITGPAGQTLANAQLEYTVRGSAGAQLSASGLLRAEQPGVAVVRASLPAAEGGSELAGECVVTFTAAEPTAGTSSANGASSGANLGSNGTGAASTGTSNSANTGSGAVGSCGNPSRVSYCEFVDAPALVRGTGQTARLRVAVYRETGCFGDRPSVEVSSPEAVRLGVEGVVDIGADGLFRSVGVGLATYQASVEGVPCETAGVYVDLDPSGTWSATCDNGDTGSLTIGPQPTYLLTHLTTMGYPTLTSQGCYQNSRDGFACNAAASLSLAAEPAVRGVQDWRCSASSPCYGGENPDTCRETREPVLGRDQVRVAVTGPNSFAIRGCRYTRGGSGGGACGGVAQGNYQGSWQQVCTYSDEYGSETIGGPLALNVQGNRVVMSVNSGNEFDITTELTGTLQPDGSFQIDIEDCILEGTVRNDTATGTFVCDSSEDGYIDICNGTWSAPRSGQ